MRVAALVHFYVPFRNAGSETMLHTLLRSLSGIGHEVQAFATDIPEAPYLYDYDGVRVNSTNWFLAQQEITRFGPDVIVTHHQNTVNAIRLARTIGAKSVFLMHNDFSQNRKYLACKPDLTVFNTEWIRDVTEYRGESIVIHPPVFAHEHRTLPGDRVTLVNLNESKGGKILYRLAELMPDVGFLGVLGGHGEQIVRTDLPNVEIVEHTDRMIEQVWSRTKVLLMPSIYESYGMAGVEAIASGIPVIAHPTPGLRESLGPAGVFVHREDLQALSGQIRRLLDPSEWQVASAAALARSKELDPSDELKTWVTRLEELTR